MPTKTDTGTKTFNEGDQVSYNGKVYTVDSFSVGAYETYMSISRDYTNRDGFPCGECVDIADPNSVTLLRAACEITLF